MSNKHRPNWSDLDECILSLIIKRINHPSDHIRISAVCSSWRSTALSNRYTLSHPIPGLIISNPSNPSYRKFINFPLSDRLNCLTNIPSSHNCRGSYAGWVVLTADDNSSIYLLNPFIERLCLLPPTPNNNVKKAILSSSPSLDIPKCVVLILFQDQGAAFCRVGDVSWTALKFCLCDECGLSDAIFFDKRIGVVDDYGKVYTCNLDDHTIREMECQPSDVSIMKTGKNKFYLVEIKGQLCRVLRNVSVNEHSFYFDMTSDDGDIYLTVFRVLKMDPGMKEWVEVGCLGEYALFLGMNNSLSLSVLEVDGIKGNKVYFTDDRQKNGIHLSEPEPGTNMGVFDMDSSKVDEFCWGQCFWLKNTDTPAVWVAPLPW